MTRQGTIDMLCDADKATNIFIERGRNMFTVEDMIHQAELAKEEKAPNGL